MNFFFGEGRSIVTIDEFVGKFRPRGDNVVKEVLFGPKTMTQDEFMEDFNLKMEEMEEIIERTGNRQKA